MNTKSWPPAPFARVSRAGLAEMVFERECSVESRGPDKYGRSIGRVSVDAADENAVKKKTTADHSDLRLKSDGFPLVFLMTTVPTLPWCGAAPASTSRRA